MAIPDVDIAINPVWFPWEVVMKAQRAVEKVEERLHRTVAALRSGSVPFVVIGGNAVAVWVATRDEGAIRNTKDVDILLGRLDLEQAAKVMAQAGFDLAEVNGVTMFLDREDPMPSRAIHVVFAGEQIKPGDVCPAPQVKVGMVSPKGVPAIDLRELLILKLIPFRRIDQVHIADMCRVGLVDDEVAAQIPPELRPRLEEIRANPDA